jgi:hypothetical protein
MGEVVQFVPRSNQNRFNVANHLPLIDHLADILDYSSLVQTHVDPELPCDVGMGTARILQYRKRGT